MEVDTTCEMDKVTLLKKTDDDAEFSLPKTYDESTPNSESDSDFSTLQNKKVLIEKIKGIKFARREINSKNVTLSKICDDRSVINTSRRNVLHQNQSTVKKRNDKDVKCGIEIKNALKAPKTTKTPKVKSHRFKSLPVSPLANFMDEDNDLDPLLKRETEINVFNPWNVSDLSVFLRYCCPECDYKCEEAHLFCEHALDFHRNSNVLLENLRGKKSQTNVQQEMNDDYDESFEVVQDFEDFDNEYSLNEDPKGQSISE